MSEESGPSTSFTADQQEWIEQLVSARVASTGVGATAPLPTGTSEPSSTTGETLTVTTLAAGGVGKSS